ncbi:MAG: tRNA (adenosine(37)-N6)-dimethylallyltransferase MiaA, partial [Gallionella sp.]|nr:tRNA (adenosine(37)-N6)-dimethylallyltransferase MiaA [Gallionella sp.]
GGTMLYFKALREGLSDLPQADPEVRAELDAEIAQYGIRHLHRQLAQVDAETAVRLKPTDTQRIQRAMEIYRLTGQPMSVLFKQQTQHELPYRIHPITLIPSERAQLHARIATRFRQMLAQGLVEELRDLRRRYDLRPDLPSMRCVGYRQAWQFIEGEIDEKQLLESGIAATRQLAKRQLTWLRSTPDIIELDCLQENLNEHVISVLEQAKISIS